MRANSNLSSRSAVAFAMLLWLGAAAWPASARADGAALRAAVLPFEAPHADAELQPLGKALADMLATDLSNSRDLVLVERERLAALKQEIALGRSGAVDRATAARAGKLLGAELLIVGRLTAARPKLRIDARAVSAESGEVVATASAEGTVDTFFDVERELATRLLDALGATLAPLARMKLRKPATRSLSAALAYGRALDAHDRGDSAAARKALSAAVAADPGFAAAKARLDALQKRVEALEARTEAVETAGGRILRPSHPVDHLHNADIASGRGEHERAVEDLRAVWKERPASVQAATLWARLPARLDAKAPPAARAWIAVARALRTPGEAALGLAPEVRADPKTAAARAAAWFRLLALRAAPTKRLAAEERREASWLGARLATFTEDREVFVREDDVRAAQTLAATARAERAEPVGPAAHPALPAGLWPRPRRATLRARPVALSMPERTGKSAPWLEVQVRVADVGSRDVRVEFVGTAGALALPPVADGGFGGDATVFRADWPHGRAFPQQGASLRAVVRRVDPRGIERTTTLELPPPRVWSGDWRNLGRGIGRAVPNRYPMFGVQLAPLALEKGSAPRTWRVLVDPVARVWADLPADADGVLWSALYGASAGPLLQGETLLGIGAAGERSLGRRVPLVVRDGASVVALGSARLERVLPAEGKSGPYVTATRAGWMDGPLDGWAAVWDVDVTVRALLRAEEPALARQALQEALSGTDAIGRSLLLEAGPERDALAALCAADTSLPRAIRGLGVEAAIASCTAAPDKDAPAKAQEGPRRLSSGVRVDGRRVTVDDYAACVAARACPRLLEDRCVLDALGTPANPPLRGDQPARCLPLRPNPYPVTWVRRIDAQAYCAARGGRLPSATEWRERIKLQADVHVNILDRITCALTEGVRREGTPADCDPHRDAARPLDAWGWWAPESSSAPHRSNTREWVSDAPGADALGVAIGCGAHDAGLGDCDRTRPVPTLAAADIGFRCAYDRADAPHPFRAAPRAGVPAARWLAVPAGKVWVGAPLPRPTVDLAQPDAAATSALVADVPGLPAKALERLLAGLRAAGVTGSVDGWDLEELLARARWAGHSPDQAIDGWLAAVRGEDESGLQPLRLAPNLDWMRKRVQRESARTPGPSLGQRVQDALLRDLRRHGARETPKPDGAMVWHDDRAVRCDDRPLARCEDPTGTASNRVTSHERKIRQLDVDAFEMQETEVTGEQFAAVMGFDPSLRPCADCPVERVRWDEADAFCRKIGGSLPTEAQWVRAARGDAKVHRPQPLDVVARWRGNSDDRPGKVGTRAPGPFGHKDLLGGVWEWAADVHATGYGLELLDQRRRMVPSEKVDPTLPAGQVCWQVSRSTRNAERNLADLPWQEDKRHGDYACFADEATADAALEARLLKNPRGPVPDPDSRRERRVLLGGSFASDERLVSPSARVGYAAAMRSVFVGFRCVRVPR